MGCVFLFLLIAFYARIRWCYTNNKQQTSLLSPSLSCGSGSKRRSFFFDVYWRLTMLAQNGRKDFQLIFSQYNEWQYPSSHRRHRPEIYIRQPRRCCVTQACNWYRLNLQIYKKRIYIQNKKYYCVFPLLFFSVVFATQLC